LKDFGGPEWGSAIFEKAFLQSAGKLFQGNADCFADFANLEYVQPALSGFIFADKGLRLTELSGKLRLAQIGFSPDLSKEILKFLLLRSVDALFHGGRSIERVEKYPKIEYFFKFISLILPASRGIDERKLQDSSRR